MSVHVVIMGVSGCGKTTVAQAVADRLGLVMAEGDDFHPKANVEKMSHGIPLGDEDRWPWLRIINEWMIDQDRQGKGTVVSCSALKKAYRDVLRHDLDVLFVHLSGSQELIGTRLAKRTGHYMPPSLLPSQFADLQPLEPGENGVEIGIEGTPEQVEDQALAAVRDYLAKQQAE
ncbi:gluconokinase [Bifidobacterium sp. ESL0763]|uniref:gluconokinase n=1 Tax=Bifidobacterium sp. ESL0763 TaxID=2983227 RepID=UPI0023F6BA1F|nr:gluconokinase [Bifidobacterium sp. ESL0763]MDF7664007.1 gluconokinase [Bifidobacterium sp. ESL0763]